MVRDEAALASRSCARTSCRRRRRRAEGIIALVLDYAVRVALGAGEGGARARPRFPPAVASRVVRCPRGSHAAHEARDLAGTPPASSTAREPHNVIVGTTASRGSSTSNIAKAAVRLAHPHRGPEGQARLHGARADPPEEVDRRTDIFAAGATLYESITGEPLFDGWRGGRPPRRPHRAPDGADGPWLRSRARRAPSGAPTSPDDRFPDARAFRRREHAPSAGVHDEARAWSRSTAARGSGSASSRARRDRGARAVRHRGRPVQKGARGQRPRPRARPVGADAARTLAAA